MNTRAINITLSIEVNLDFRLFTCVLLRYWSGNLSGNSDKQLDKENNDTFRWPTNIEIVWLRLIWNFISKFIDQSHCGNGSHLQMFVMETEICGDWYSINIWSWKWSIPINFSNHTNFLRWSLHDDMNSWGKIFYTF